MKYPPDADQVVWAGESIMSAIKLGGATVDTAIRTIGIDGKIRRISPKASAVLSALIEARGAVIERETLLSQVWPDVIVGEEVLTQAIAELRRAFRDNSKSPQFIETLPKSGYRLLPTLSPATIISKERAPLFDSSSEPRLETLLTYMKATEYLEKRGRHNIDRAIELFSEAIASEPSFALAYAGYSFSIAYRHNFYSQEKYATKKALDSAQKAICLDRFAPEAYTALGYALSQKGEYDHAITSYNAALRLRMDSYYSLMRLGRVLFMKRDYGAAKRLFDRAAQVEGSSPHAHILSTKAWFAEGDEKGAAIRLNRAEMLCDKHLETEIDDLRSLVCKTIIVIETQGVAAASSLIDRLNFEERPFTYYLVGALVRAGEISLALNRLEMIAENGWSDPGFLHADRDLDAIRNEPKFKKIANAIAA